MAIAIGRVAVIMPTYNERGNIETMLGRVRAAVPDANILVVDDNSPDGTGGIADETICLNDCYGNLKPSSYFHASVGNVKQVPFRELWFNSKVFNDLRDFPKYQGKCGECEFLNVCGGCRARAYAVSGDYLAAEPFCTYEPVKARK